MTSNKPYLKKIVSALSFLPLCANSAIYTNGSKTQTFDVTMTVVADCNISVASLNFGQNQGILNNIITTNSNLSVTCTSTTPYNIGFNEGTGTGSTGTNRYMSGTGTNTETVKFNLYQDNSKTEWGNIQGTNTKSGTGSGTIQNYTIYGEVPVQNTPRPDSYKTTITASIYF